MNLTVVVTMAIFAIFIYCIETWNRDSTPEPIIIAKIAILGAIVSLGTFFAQDFFSAEIALVSGAEEVFTGIPNF